MNDFKDNELYQRELFKNGIKNHWSSTIDHSVFLLLLHKDVKLTCSISLYCLTEQYLSVTLLFIRLFTSQHKNQQYIYPYPSIRFYNLKTDLTLFNKFLGVDNCFVFSWPRQQDWCSKVERVWPTSKLKTRLVIINEMDWHSYLKLHGNLKRNLSGRNFHSSLSDPVGAKGGTGWFSASEIQKFNLRVTFKKEIHQKVQGSKKKRTEK